MPSRSNANRIVQSVDLEALRKKLEHLKDYLAQRQRVLVSFSGGVDSTLLLKVAKEVLGGDALAVLVTSPLHLKQQLQEAKAIASHLGVELYELELDELSIREFAENSLQRCYFCKRLRFSKIQELSEKLGVRAILEGSNLDDLRDFRPGMRAKEELGILSPFVEIGMGKSEIRHMAKEFGLPNWDAPSSSCLATRVPFGVPLSREVLERIEKAEEGLLSLGFKGSRVRYHGGVARIELPEAELSKALRLRREIVEKVKASGFRFVALDLEGYRPSGISFGGGK